MTSSELLAAYDLPCKWESIRLRWLSKRYAGGTPDTKSAEYWEGGTIPWLNSGAVNQGTITEPSDYITELALQASSAKWIPRGALVMALAGQGKTKATVGYLDIRATGNQSLAAVVPEKIDGKFLYWWLSSQYLTIRNLSSQDGRDGLNLEMIGNIVCPAPPLDTQRRIARFLDEKTARIDGLIEKKRELLDRLAEKRQALITRAVTKGLDPSAPMKPTGIDWLGDIPRHWVVKRLGHVSQILLGLTYSPGDLVDESNGIFVIRASNIQNGKLTMGDDVFVNVNVPEGIVNRLGDIVVCSRNGSRNLIGKNAIVTKEWVGCTFGAFMTTIRSEHSAWVRWVLGSTLFEFQAGRYMSTTINQLTISTLKSFPIPIPPKRIADEISQELEWLCSSIDSQYDLVVQSMEKLAEYRSALITAAVTGQLPELR